MSFTAGYKSRLYYGHIGLSTYSNQAESTVSINALDVTTFGDNGNKRMIAGQESGAMSASGPLEMTATAFATRIAILQTIEASSPIPFTYFPFGTDIDGAAHLFAVRQSAFTPSSTLDDAAQWSGEFVADGVIDMNGTLLSTATITADTDSTAHNNGAATTNGAVFHLHVTAYSGFTSDAIIVEGSATGAFAGEETTIATFTTQTAATFALGGSQRLTVTGTVPQYLRVADDVTGTGSITRTVAVSRR